jgi:hypothetical protein
MSSPAPAASSGTDQRGRRGHGRATTPARRRVAGRAVPAEGGADPRRQPERPAGQRDRHRSGGQRPRPAAQVRAALDQQGAAGGQRQQRRVQPHRGAEADRPGGQPEADHHDGQHDAERDRGAEGDQGGDAQLVPVLVAQPAGEHAGDHRDGADGEVGHRRPQAQRERAAQQHSGRQQHEQVAQPVTGQRGAVLVPDGEHGADDRGGEHYLPHHVYPYPVPRHRTTVHGGLDRVGLHGRSPYR